MRSDHAKTLERLALLVLSFLLSQPPFSLLASSLHQQQVSHLASVAPLLACSMSAVFLALVAKQDLVTASRQIHS